MRKWTNEQETIILKEAEATPDHLRDAFRRAAYQIGRTPEAVTTRFYNVLMKRNEKIQPNSTTHKSNGNS